MAAFTQDQMKKFSYGEMVRSVGPVAIVTGGATGLGLAITRCLVSAGARVGRAGPKRRRRRRTFWRNLGTACSTFPST